MTPPDATETQRRLSVNQPFTSVLVEAAVDSFDGALAAQAAQVHRIELCGPLHDGGTTPSAGLIAACSDELLVSVNVLVRPRAGNFVYSEDEIEIMKKDIAISKELGVDGVAFGVLTAEGDVDTERMAELISIATPMRVVFHRAFDSVRDQDEALELLVTLQINGILTSGASKTAESGIARLKSLEERAARRIRIIAAGSITSANVRKIVEGTGVTAVHGRAYDGVVAALG
jgi:copper homeostasis protein